MSTFIRQQLNNQNKSEYQVYEDGLNQYKRRKINQIKSSQWDPLSSRLASPLSDSKYFPSSDQKDKVQRNQGFVKKLQSQSLPKKDDKGIFSFSQQFKQKLDSRNPRQKSNEVLQQEIKSMRESLILLNNAINNKINKYQLHQFKPKGLAPINEPQKQSQLLLSQIQTNTKILEAFQKQIREIKERDKLLQQKDYLIELEESANQVMARIKDIKKQKHNGKVVVEKLDGRLLEMKEASLQDQFKMVKVVKHNTVYFYKKIKENDKILEDLDRTYKQMQQKDQKLTQELNKYTTLAQQKNMPVKTNPNYLQKIKTQNQLSKATEQHRKKVDVIKRSKQAQCLKISLEIEKIKKQLLSTEAKLQQYQIRDKQITAVTETAMQKSKLDGKMLNKVSQRYAEGIGMRMIRNIVKESAQHQQEQNPKIVQKQKSLNTSLESPSQYRTLSLKPSAKLSRFKKQHEANSQTLQFQNTERKQYRVKPSLHLRKINKQSQHLNQPTLTQKHLQTIKKDQN